jgi:hypothetical protein
MAIKIFLGAFIVIFIAKKKMKRAWQNFAIQLVPVYRQKNH